MSFVPRGNVIAGTGAFFLRIKLISKNSSKLLQCETINQYVSVAQLVEREIKTLYRFESCRWQNFIRV